MFCPHCSAEISHLDYRIPIIEYGIEYGTCDLSGDNMEAEENDTNDTDYNYSEVEYKCPECRENLSRDELLDEIEEDEEDDPFDDDDDDDNDSTQPYIVSNHTQSNKLITVECKKCKKINIKEKIEEEIFCSQCNNII